MDDTRSKLQGVYPNMFVAVFPSAPANYEYSLVFLLSLPLPRPPLPIIQIYHPLPTPIRTGAPLFIPAVRNIDKPHRLPAVNKNQLVAFVTSPTKNNCVHYIGVGRVAAEGGMKGAWERRVDHLMDGGDREEGKFSDILCIIDDQ